MVSGRKSCPYIDIKKVAEEVDKKKESKVPPIIQADVKCKLDIRRLDELVARLVVE